MRHLASVLSAIALLTIASAAVAQPVSTAGCSYESCGVRLQTGFFSEHLVRGDSGAKVMKIGFTGGNVADYLSRVESARAPARQFQTSRTRAAVLGIISGVAAAFAYSSVSSDGGFDEDISTGALVAFGVAIPTAIWAGVETARSRNAISQAIWEFNRSPVR
jgi:hypothetical protein